MGGVDTRIRHRDVHVRATAARRDVPRLGGMDGRESPKLSRDIPGIVGLPHDPGDAVGRCRKHVGSRPQVLHQLFRRPGLGANQSEDAVAGLGQGPVGLGHPCSGGRRPRRQPERFRPALHGRRRHRCAGRPFEDHQRLARDVRGGQSRRNERGAQKRRQKESSLLCHAFNHPFHRIFPIELPLPRFPHPIFSATPPRNGAGRGGSGYGKAPSENEGAFILHQEQDRLERSRSMERNPAFSAFSSPAPLPTPGAGPGAPPS